MPAVPNVATTTVCLDNVAQETMARPQAEVLATTPLLLVVIVYLFGPKAFRWRFPCQTTDDLDAFVEKLERLIMLNSSLDTGVLEDDVTDGFYDALAGLNNQVKEIKLRDEPRRTNPFIWLHFYWFVLVDVDSCYEELRVLERKIKTKLYSTHREMRWNHDFI